MKPIFFYKYIVLRLPSSIVILSILFTGACSQKVSSVLESHALLELKIKNMKYEYLSLFTHIKHPAGYDNGFEIPGTSTDGFKWTFIVLDSINQVVEGYFVRTQPFNFERNEEKALTFSADKVSDIKNNVIILRDKITTIEGKYAHQISKSYNNGVGYLLVDTFIINPTISADVINLDLKHSKRKSELEILFTYPRFEETDRYTLDERLEIIKKYPYSIYLLNSLLSLSKSLNKRDLNLLFNLFTNEMQHSKLGNEVFNYINIEITPFSVDTLSLVSSKDGNMEPIIKEHSKYTLIIFSASWCAPCHKQIPLLKKVFYDCKDHLDMVYISIDRNDEIEIWNKVLVKEGISWRSLFAGEYRKGLLKNYRIEGIPYSLLVHPDGTIEAIDVRNKSHLDKLYKLITINLK